MVELIQRNLVPLRTICARHRVHRLELFGSATTGGFDPDSSDLDFLVEFQPLGPGEHADTYFGLREALETLFGRPVDLVMIRAVRNPTFLARVNHEREVLYAA